MRLFGSRVDFWSTGNVLSDVEQRNSPLRVAQSRFHLVILHLYGSVCGLNYWGMMQYVSACVLGDIDVQFLETAHIHQPMHIWCAFEHTSKASWKLLGVYPALRCGFFIETLILHWGSILQFHSRMFKPRVFYIATWSFGEIDRNRHKTGNSQYIGPHKTPGELQRPPSKGREEILISWLPSTQSPRNVRYGWRRM